MFECRSVPGRAVLSERAGKALSASAWWAILDMLTPVGVGSAPGCALRTVSRRVLRVQGRSMNRIRSSTRSCVASHATASAIQSSGGSDANG